MPPASFCMEGIDTSPSALQAIPNDDKDGHGSSLSPSDLESNLASLALDDESAGRVSHSCFSRALGHIEGEVEIVDMGKANRRERQKQKKREAKSTLRQVAQGNLSSAASFVRTTNVSSVSKEGRMGPAEDVIQTSSTTMTQETMLSRSTASHSATLVKADDDSGSKMRRTRSRTQKSTASISSLTCLSNDLSLLVTARSKIDPDFELHTPVCECRGAFWKRRMETGEAKGYVISMRTNKHNHREAIKPILVYKCSEHTLEGEQAALTVLKGVYSNSHLRLAKCCRKSVPRPLSPSQPSCAPGPSLRSGGGYKSATPTPTLSLWSLHGAAIIVGDLHQLQAFAARYAFKAQATRMSDDEACCLLAAPLPSSGRFSSFNSSLKLAKASFLDALFEITHPYHGGKEEPNAVGHHLGKILSRKLTREVVAKAILKVEGRILRMPALLAMGQEWPERFTVDSFGGKREVGESSLEAAFREAKEESAGWVRLGEEEEEAGGKNGSFGRLPSLDFTDDSMAFFGFFYRGEEGLEETNETSREAWTVKEMRGEATAVNNAEQKRNEELRSEKRNCSVEKGRQQRGGRGGGVGGRGGRGGRGARGGRGGRGKGDGKRDGIGRSEGGMTVST